MTAQGANRRLHAAMPGETATILDFLEVAARDGGGLAFRYLRGGAVDAADELSFGELRGRVDLAAAAPAHRLGRGERALLCFLPGLDFVVAFLACLRAGVVAVPVVPATTARGAAQLRAIARDAGVAAILADAPLAAVPQTRELADQAAAAVLTLDDLDGGAAPPPAVDPESIA